MCVGEDSECCLVSADVDVDWVLTDGDEVGGRPGTASIKNGGRDRGSLLVKKLRAQNVRLICFSNATSAEQR